jgi:type II secretory pathway pseudopilin PulG
MNYKFSTAVIAIALASLSPTIVQIASAYNNQSAKVFYNNEYHQRIQENLAGSCPDSSSNLSTTTLTSPKPTHLALDTSSDGVGAFRLTGMLTDNVTGSGIVAAPIRVTIIEVPELKGPPTPSPRIFQIASTLSPDRFFETTVHVPTGETGIWEVVVHYAGDVGYKPSVGAVFLTV